VYRGLERGYCFSVPMGHPWPVPRFIPGASHGKTVHPPQSPVGFTVLFELLIPVLLQEKPEKYMVIVSVAVFDKA